MRILSVIGTRPEAIKMAPVIQALSTTSGVDSIVCVTAQHRHMLDQVLKLFKITPHHDLNVMRPGQDLTDLTNRILAGMRDVLELVKPDVVLVQGDTTTAFAAALAAFYQRVQIGHIEAGLRTGDIYSPWPEEVNRRMISTMTSSHFAPTREAGNNLLREGVSENALLVTGNTVIDSLHQVIARLQHDRALADSQAELFPFLDSSKKLILVTGHRRENHGEGIEQICLALTDLAVRKDVQIVYPVHLNPHIHEPVHRLLNGHAHIYLIPPLDYLPFIYLLSKSYLVVTDSGGLQEEAPALGKPVLVIRDTTERPEAILAGTAQLIGTTRKRLFESAVNLLDSPAAYSRMSRAVNPYGDGMATGRIVGRLLGKQVAPFKIANS